MNVDIVERPHDGGLWLTARVEGHDALGGYVAGQPGGEFTVFWLGELKPGPLARVLGQAEHLFSTTFQGVDRKLFAYGDEKQVYPIHGSSEGFFLEHFNTEFKFYRLELSVPNAFCMVWMDFSTQGLLDSEENIGISLSPALLNHEWKALIRKTIRQTRSTAEIAAPRLFKAIRDKIVVPAPGQTANATV